MHTYTITRSEVACDCELWDGKQAQRISAEHVQRLPPPNGRTHEAPFCSKYSSSTITRGANGRTDVYGTQGVWKFRHCDCRQRHRQLCGGGGGSGGIMRPVCVLVGDVFTLSPAHIIVC